MSCSCKSISKQQQAKAKDINIKLSPKINPLLVCRILDYKVAV